MEGGGREREGEGGRKGGRERGQDKKDKEEYRWCFRERDRKRKWIKCKRAAEKVIRERQMRTERMMIRE